MVLRRGLWLVRDGLRSWLAEARWTLFGVVWLLSSPVPWTVTHPDAQDTGRGIFGSKVWLCAIAVIAPEAVAVLACLDYARIRHYFKVVNKMNKGQWTMSQLFFVHMEGVNLEFEDCTEAVGCDSDGVFDDNDALDVFQRALQLNLLDAKCVSAEDVKKRAKTIYIVKALVCLQVLWLVVQVIGRAVAKLPITTLEIVTIGYVICALITYSCWWHKPQDAEVLITLNCRSLTKAKFHQQIKALQDTSYVERWWEIILRCVISRVFGAIHCTAWNFVFFTFAESIIWRVASVLTVVFPIGFQVSSLFDNRKAVWPLLFLYVPVRLYLMIEPFVAFRSVPVGIFYTVSWSTWIPHV
jgi:hypothetical protein